MGKILTKHQIDEILADIVVAGGDYADPECVYRRILAEKEKCHGPGHPEVARTAASLALVLFYMNRKIESDEILTKAEKILATAGEASDAVFETKRVLAKLYRLKEDHVRSEAAYEDVVEYLENAEGSDNELLLDPLLYLGAVYVKTEKFALSEICWKRVIEIDTSHLRSEVTWIEAITAAEFLHEIAREYSVQGHIARAKTLLRWLLDNMKDNSGLSGRLRLGIQQEYDALHGEFKDT